MRVRSLLRLTPILFLLAGCTLPEGAIPSISLSDLRLSSLGLPGLGDSTPRAGFTRMAASGKRVLLWGETSINPDCSIIGPSRLEIIEAPYHGSTFVQPGPLYPVYPSGDPRAHCSAKPVQGMLAFYTSEPGYRGQDQVQLRGVAADGSERELTVVVDVR